MKDTFYYGICAFLTIIFGFSAIIKIDEYKCKTATKMLNYKNPNYNIFVGCVMETQNNEKAFWIN